MNRQEVDQLILEVTNMIKEKAKFISLEQDEFDYILAEKELQDLKAYLILLKSLRNKFNMMARVDIKEYEEKIRKIKDTVKDYYQLFTVEEVKKAIYKEDKYGK